MSTYLEHKTKKQCITAFIVTFLLAIIVTALVFLHGRMEEGMIALQKNVITTEGQDIAALRRATRAYEEHALLLDNALIPQDATIPFLEDLQRLADRANVASEIITIELYDITETDERIRTSPGMITAERAHGELYVTMATRGSWGDTMNFLSFLESAPHPAVIQDMRLSFGRGDSEESSVWAAVFSIQITTQ